MRHPRPPSAALAAGILLGALAAPALFSGPSHAQAKDPCTGKPEYLINPGTKKRYTPKELKDKKNSFSTISLTDIRTCIENEKFIQLHRIDFEDYAWMWKHLAKEKSNYKIPVKIFNSVLFSSSRNGIIHLGEFADPGLKTGRDLSGVEQKITRIEETEPALVINAVIDLRDNVFGPRWIAGRGKDFKTRRPGTIYRADVNFARSHFPHQADFYRAMFRAPAVRFFGAIFGDKANFSSVSFNERTNFENTKFGKVANFKKATFGKEPNFRGANFDDGIKFDGTTFGKDADFRSTIFKGTVYFIKSIFLGDTDFRNTFSEDKMNFSETAWGGRADFRKGEIGKLLWDSTDRPSNVNGIFDIRGAKIGTAIFKEIRFRDLADFSEARFRDSRFENVTFDQEADFLQTEFEGPAIFIRNRFRKTLDMTGAKFEDPEARLCLEYNRISRLVLESKHLGALERLGGFLPAFDLRNPIRKPLVESRIRGVKNGECVLMGGSEPLKDIYASLQRSFKKAGDRTGGNEAYFLRTVAERNQSSDNSYTKKLAGFFDWLILDLPSRHGIDMIRSIWVSAWLIFIFGGIYGVMFGRWKKTGRVVPAAVTLRGTLARDRIFRFRPFDNPFDSTKQGQRELMPVRDAFFLSARAFLKLGLGTSYPAMRPLKIVVYFEWLLGAFMLIHFLIALKNTLPIALPFLGAGG